MAKGKYKYYLTGTVNYPENERDIDPRTYRNEEELWSELGRELKNNKEATSWVITIARCPQKATKRSQ